MSTPKVDGETAQKIALDVGMNVPPEKSKRVKYGEAELAFRRQYEREADARRQTDPKAVMQIPE